MEKRFEYKDLFENAFFDDIEERSIMNNGIRNMLHDTEKAYFALLIRKHEKRNNLVYLTSE